MRLMRAMLLVVAAALAGCGPSSLVTSEEQAAAIAFIADLYAGRDSGALSSMEPSLKAEAPAILAKIHAIIPRSLDPKPVLMDARFTDFHMAGAEFTRAAELVYDVNADGHIAWVLIDFAHSDKGMQITGFRVAPGSVTELYPLDLGKVPLAYVFIALQLLVVAITIAAMVLVWCTPNIRFRWLWTIGCVLGFGQLLMETAGGAVIFNPFTIMLLSASFTRTGYFQPWILGAAVPVAAIVFLILRNRLSRSDAAATPENSAEA